MYGAILIPETDLTKTGEADIGVLFCHNGEIIHVQCAYMYILNAILQRDTRRCVVTLQSPLEDFSWIPKTRYCFQGVKRSGEEPTEI